MASGKPLIATFLITMMTLLSMILNLEACFLLHPRPNLYHKISRMLIIPLNTLPSLSDYLFEPHKRTIKGPIETPDNLRPNQEDDDYNDDNTDYYFMDPISGTEAPVPNIPSPPIIPDPDPIPSFPWIPRRKRPKDGHVDLTVNLEMEHMD